MRIALIIVLLSILPIPGLAQATTYYTCGNGATCGAGWSTGNNSNTCTSKSSPCQSIVGGLAKIASGAGDTLIIGNGTYNERLRGDTVPNGSDGHYTKIRAENVHGVSMTNSAYTVLDIGERSYVWVDGLNVSGNNAAMYPIYIGNSNHIKVTRCAATGALEDNNNWVIIVSHSDYVLIEECWAWGYARYKMGSFESTRVIFRRNVARHDYTTSGIPVTPFVNYDGYLTVWQNNIAIDSDPTNIYSQPGGMHGGFYFENKNTGVTGHNSTEQILNGNIVLNCGSGTYTAGVISRHSGPFTADNMVIYGQRAGFLIEPNPGDTHFTALNHWTVGGLTGTYGSSLYADGTSLGYIDGLVIGHNTNYLAKNSVLFNNHSYGITDWVISDWNAFYGNGSGNAGGVFHTPSIGTHSITTTNPLTNGLLYLPRVEAGSTLKTAGESGTQMGAEVMYKVGVSGTLYGETGWNTTTTDPLWPFPNEALIKTDMASYSGSGPTGARGFAATGNQLNGTSPITLTSYIWEYLGNQMPTDIYAATEIDGACGSNSGGSFYSLTELTPGNCATGTVASFTGTGGWTWGCNGSGGGTSTSSTACSASLLTDLIAPTITAFDMPSTYGTVVVPVTSFTATDATGVTGYCITLINSPNSCVWTGSAPTTATGIYGTNTFYGWAKDLVGNISTASTDQTTITPETFTYFVAPTGNDTTGDGTSGNPFLTIQKGVNMCVTGDCSVGVQAGTYRGFYVSNHGSVGHPILIKAIGTVNISTPHWRDGTERTDGINLDAWMSPYTDYVTIDGFTVYDMPRMGIRAIGGAGIIIQNCTVHDNADTGIFTGDTPGVQVLNNNSYANGTTQFQHNIYVSNAQSDNTVIRGNTIHDSNAGNGLHVNGDYEEGGDGYIDNAIIENNLVYNNAAKGLSLTSIRYGTIRNNIIYNNSGAGGIHLVEQGSTYYSINNVVVNNTIDEDDTATVRINANNTGNVVFNNVSIGSPGIVFEGSGNFQSNNITTSTGFTNYATHNYMLVEGSDKINTGLATYQSKAAATADYLGVARPQDTDYDVGAYEFIVGGPYGNAGLSGSGNAVLSGPADATIH